jgi:hypothetical protein
MQPRGSYLCTVHANHAKRLETNHKPRRLTADRDGLLLLYHTANRQNCRLAVPRTVAPPG